MSEKMIKDHIIRGIMGIEGGYSDNANDSGGKTRYGVIEAVARKHSYTGHMKDLPYELAYKIYEVDYWNPCKLDDISKYGYDLCHEIMDTAINAGNGRIGEFLQRCLNVLNDKQRYYNDIIVDGDIGKNTLRALDLYYATRGKEKAIKRLVKMLNCLQGAFYIGLAEAREKDETFIAGWIDNRVVI